MKSFFRLPLLLDLINSYFTYILVVPLIVAPLERIKVIMQTNSIVQGQWACFKNILFTEGIRGVFKGTLVTFARDMPSFATYFVVYDIMRHKFKESRIDLGPVGITIVSGATAGIAGKAKLYIETNFENGVKVHIF